MYQTLIDTNYQELAAIYAFYCRYRRRMLPMYQTLIDTNYQELAAIYAFYLALKNGGVAHSDSGLLPCYAGMT
ncbi:MAG: hypothetical protein P8Z77_17390 [Candidatus Thiodiazotropha sp.]